MTLTQIMLLVFLFFALSRVVVRFRSAEISFPGLFLWSGIFSVAIIIVIFPWVTSEVAVKIGVGRGADAVIYLSVVLLFYLVFRLYVYMQDVRRELSEFVTEMALRDMEKEYETPKSSSD